VHTMLSILNMMQHQFTAFSSIFLFPACVAPGPQHHMHNTISRPQ
jgi:hypothetical protein